ncbi:DUF2934 domain-containing protein [Bradyrhizobium sp. Pear77]|uniref:DUF2934 domain-containing protein n=1 Tax=Bradyrhizobium altum TaxID=1571202 RepID=UPI001E4FC240|nr:DUF2934 domain-containing protein [Bradyrhizobium altum]MCC8952916.1 DUF2934 domain-containing protein [Bradyrhizobium altum]
MVAKEGAGQLLWQAAGELEGQQDRFRFQAERELTQPDPAVNPEDKTGTFTA